MRGERYGASDNNDYNNPAAPGIFPPLGGIRFIVGTYAPNGVVAPEPTPEMRIEDDDEPGFHRTDTTDFGVLLLGNMALELDDGAEVLRKRSVIAAYC